MQNKRCEGDGNKVNVRTEMEVCSVFFRFVLFLPQTMRPHATSYVVHWLRGPYTQSPHQQLCSTSAACRSGLVDAYSGKALDLISCACRATKCRRRRRRHILELKVFGKQSLF